MHAPPPWPFGLPSLRKHGAGSFANSPCGLRQRSRFFRPVLAVLGTAEGRRVPACAVGVVREVGSAVGCNALRLLHPAGLKQATRQFPPVTGFVRRYRRGGARGLGFAIARSGKRHSVGWAACRPPSCPTIHADGPRSTVAARTTLRSLRAAGLSCVVGNCVAAAAVHPDNSDERERLEACLAEQGFTRQGALDGRPDAAEQNNYQHDDGCSLPENKVSLARTGQVGLSHQQCDKESIEYSKVKRKKTVPGDQGNRSQWKQYQ